MVGIAFADDVKPPMCVLPASARALLVLTAKARLRLCPR